MGAIVDIQLQRLRQLLASRKIDVALTEAARGLLASRGYDPAYGARPLKRVIQKSIQDPLAEEILAGRVKDGDKVEVGVAGGHFTFNGLIMGGAPEIGNIVTLQ
jgi:ATP-dependent Clp protease ATP-binding subunit ClpB